MNIGVWLSYDGTRYDGWQKQGNTDRTSRASWRRFWKSWKAVRWRSTVQDGQTREFTQKARWLISIWRRAWIRTGL